jgi:hypothetical protein
MRLQRECMVLMLLMGERRAANIENVQACKDFITRNITPSTVRTAALTKYLLHLSKLCSPRSPGSLVESVRPKDEDEGLGRMSDGKRMQPPDAAFKRLHLLYIVHDVLCLLVIKLKEPQHAKSNLRCEDSAMETLKTHAVLLAQLAACSENKSRHGRPSSLDSVRRILKLWQKLNIFDPDTCSKIETKCEEASNTPWNSLQQKLEADEAQAVLDEQRRREEARKWMLPMQHQLPHDSTAAWHELPAANALLQKRTQGYPLRAGDLPMGGYRLRNGGRLADESLKADVAELHKEALRCFEKYTNADEVQDIDAMGNIIWKDRPTRNFWGFELHP